LEKSYGTKNVFDKCVGPHELKNPTQFSTPVAQFQSVERQMALIVN
jgi:homogentisate 1,2-dioxygenase